MEHIENGFRETELQFYHNAIDHMNWPDENHNNVMCEWALLYRECYIMLLLLFCIYARMVKIGAWTQHFQQNVRPKRKPRWL